MAIPPFGKSRKTAGYHGASGPKSTGRMPRKVNAGAKVNHSNGGTMHTMPETEDVYDRRVEVLDHAPRNVTQDS